MTTPPTPKPSFRLSRFVFHRLLALTYLIAFASLAVQIVGLIGHDGLLPVEPFLTRAEQFYGDRAPYLFPTVVWLWSTDTALLTLCWLGVGGSLLAAAGVAPVLTYGLLWGLYLSLTVAGQTFLAFQWDTLLLEVGLLGVLYAPLGWWPGRGPEPSAAARWLLWGLVFKLTFLSGITKLVSQDPTWSGLTALTFHYETQPLPAATSWFAHQLPGWMQMTSVAVMFVIEIAVPFLVFAPVGYRRLRAGAVALMCLLQLAIAATGNYGFFNLLTVALCLSLLDDAHFARTVGSRPRRDSVQRPPAPVPASAPRLWQAGVSIVAVIIGALSTLTLWHEVTYTSPRAEWSQEVRRVIQPFRSINGYGLFRTMTTTRPEIVIEASVDGETWEEYRFRWKPGALDRQPGFVQPHMPRVDWLMWFAALDPNGNRHWLTTLMERLLDESPAVLGLLADDPVPGLAAPPQYLRLALHDYVFTTAEERARTGHWWRREFRGYLTDTVARDR